MIKNIIAVVATVLMVSSTTLLAETRQLRFSLFTHEHHWMHKKVFLPFAEEIERNTNGELKIIFLTSGALGASNEQLQIVESGMADFTWYPPIYSRNRFPLTEATLLPFLFGSATEGTAAMMRTVDDYLEDEFNTVKLISIAVTSPSALLTKSPVNRLADLRGMNIRGSGGGQTRMLGSLGANVTSVSVSDTYMALQRGTLDGTIYPVASAPSNNLEEVIRYVNHLNFSTTPVAILGNLRMWGSLTDQQRAVILEAGRKASLEMGKGYDEEDRIGLDVILAAGGQVTELPAEELAQLHDSAQVLQDEWVQELEARGVDAKDFINLLKADSAE